MSKKCELTGISPLKGHNVSHAKNKTNGQPITGENIVSGQKTHSN